MFKHQKHIYLHHVKIRKLFSCHMPCIIHQKAQHFSSSLADPLTSCSLLCEVRVRLRWA